ncbi:hypothetical protein MRB53_038919 [Persea americana]|nr:hypothetical protein MRB53_038919 [Persea americana]
MPLPPLYLQPLYSPEKSIKCFLFPDCFSIPHLHPHPHPQRLLRASGASVASRLQGLTRHRDIFEHSKVLFPLHHAMMRYTIALLATVAAVHASPFPQGVTAIIAPSGSPPAMCSTSKSGTFGVAVIPMTTSTPTPTASTSAPTSPAKRRIRAAEPAPQGPGIIAGLITEIGDGQIQAPTSLSWIPIAAPTTTSSTTHTPPGRDDDAHLPDRRWPDTSPGVLFNACPRAPNAHKLCRYRGHGATSVSRRMSHKLHPRPDLGQRRAQRLEEPHRLHRIQLPIPVRRPTAERQPVHGRLQRVQQRQSCPRRERRLLAVLERQFLQPVRSVLGSAVHACDHHDRWLGELHSEEVKGLCGGGRRAAWKSVEVGRRICDDRSQLDTGAMKLSRPMFIAMHLRLADVGKALSAASVSFTGFRREIMLSFPEAGLYLSAAPGAFTFPSRFILQRL